MRRKVEAQVTAHGCPVEEVRFVERGDFSANIFFVVGDFVKQPRTERSGPRNKSGLKRMSERRNGDMLRDFEVGVAAAFGIERVKLL